MVILLCSFMYSQSLGDKVYKEVSRKGEIINKWLSYELLVEYNTDGNEIHSIMKKPNYYEQWYEYDNKGNVIHYKTLTDYGNTEEWYEYDSKNNKIHSKSNRGEENLV